MQISAPQCKHSGLHLVQESNSMVHCTLLPPWLLAIQGNDGHFYLARPARLHIYTIGDNQPQGRCNLSRKSKCGRWDTKKFFYILKVFLSNKIPSNECVSKGYRCKAFRDVQLLEYERIGLNFFARQKRFSSFIDLVSFPHW